MYHTMTKIMFDYLFVQISRETKETDRCILYKRRIALQQVVLASMAHIYTHHLIVKKVISLFDDKRKKRGSLHSSISPLFHHHHHHHRYCFA